MIWVALVEAVAIVAPAVVSAGLVRSLLRQQARERDLLLNKVMFLAGKPWEPPPASEPAVEEPLEYDELEPGVLQNY